MINELLPKQLALDCDANGFQTRLYENGAWRDGTKTRTLPLAELRPDALSGSGYAGSGDGFTWSSTFTAEHGGVLVRTTLRAEQAMSLNPTMILWVNVLDDLDDRQAHTWRQTVLRAPTVNAGGLGGNDLPACYLYDHATRTETICYFPPNRFAWAARRFCDFSMREVMRYHPDARYGLGLHLTAPITSITLPAGEHEFVWWFTQRPRHDVPSPWKAQRVLIETLRPLLDRMPRLTPNAVSWSEMARGTRDDLLHDDCWITVNGVTGLRAYVLGSSEVGRDKAKGFELMTQLDVLHPLLVWSLMTGEHAPPLVVERLLATLPGFERAVASFVANNYPPRDGDTFMDTWYFLENALIKLPWVAHLTGSDSLRALFRMALEGARTMAHQCHYLFPLFADAADWQSRGSLLNVSVGGLYAAGCVLGWQLFGDARWLEEAANALRTLHSLPPQQLTHEPQQLAFGAAAAQVLAGTQNAPNGTDWNAIAADLVRLSLRMGYWADDPSVPFYDPRGMFQACASLCYPAFKENVETLFSWSELLRPENAFDPALAELMAAFANLARCHNYTFFDDYLPPDKRRGSCPYIPYEDVATSEFTHTATFGKELYGAGEVFWSALLFDALGHAADPDVLCLSLNVPTLDLSSLPAQPDGQSAPSLQQLSFLVYNPASELRRTTITTRFGTRDVTLEPRALAFISVSNS